MSIFVENCTPNPFAGSQSDPNPFAQEDVNNPFQSQSNSISTSTSASISTPTPNPFRTTGTDPYLQFPAEVFKKSEDLDLHLQPKTHESFSFRDLKSKEVGLFPNSNPTDESEEQGSMTFPEENSYLESSPSSSSDDEPTQDQLQQIIIEQEEFLQQFVQPIQHQQQQSVLPDLAVHHQQPVLKALPFLSFPPPPASSVSSSSPSSSSSTTSPALEAKRREISQRVNALVKRMVNERKKQRPKPYEMQPVSDGKYQCTTCDRSFRKKFNLTRHFATHDGGATFHCEAAGCVQTFTQPSSLKRHMREIHEGHSRS